MFVIRNKVIFFIISGALVVAAIVGFIVKGFNVSIEFTGGSVLEVSYDERPEIDVLQTAFSELELPGRLQPFGEKGAVVRTQDLSEEERQLLLTQLTIDEHEPSVERFNSVGPSIGKELRTKAFIALIIVALAIIAFVAYAFRSKGKDDEEKIGPSGWKFGVIAVIALIHDVIIPAGIFAWAGFEVNSLFVVGLLSILGLSVNDTIVVFDRIRENLRENQRKSIEESFGKTVGKSLKQTVARSINTSLTLVVVLLALFFIGPGSTRDLAMIMFLGTIVGTYSSIFLASPLLVLFQKKKKGIENI